MPTEYITDGGFLASNNNAELISDNAWIPAEHINIPAILFAMDVEFGNNFYAGIAYSSTVFWIASYSAWDDFFGITPATYIIGDGNVGLGNKSFNCVLRYDKLSVILAGHQYGLGNMTYAIESNHKFTLPDNSNIVISIDASVEHDYNLQEGSNMFTLSMEPEVSIVLQKVGGNLWDNRVRTLTFNNNFDGTVTTNSFTIMGMDGGNWRAYILFQVTDNYYNDAGNSFAAHLIELDNFSITTVEGSPVIHDLEMGLGDGSVSTINFTPPETPDLVVPDVPGTVDFNPQLLSGWNIFSCPLDITTLIVGHNEHPSKSYDDLACEADETYSMDDFIKNHLYENLDDTKPVWYKNGETAEGLNEVVDIIKNNAAEVYWPIYTFNGIGDFLQFQGYQFRIKEGKTPYFKWTGVPVYSPDLGGVSTSDVMMEFINGWNIVAFPSLEEADATDFFASMVANNEIQIVKANDASVYWPNYNFNGIGNLIPGQGYQVRCENL